MFSRTIRVIRHIPVTACADIAFMLLVFFLTSVQFRVHDPRPIVIADPRILSDSSTSVHTIVCGHDRLIYFIQSGDTTSLTLPALADSALLWVRRESRTIVIMRSYPDIPSYEPLAVVALLRKAGINGVILGEITTTDK